MVNQREDHLKRRKNVRESWKHAGAKWPVGYILHELGFKVFRERARISPCVRGLNLRDPH